MKKHLMPSDPRHLPTKSLRLLSAAWSHAMPETKKERQAAIRGCRRRNLSLAAALEAVESVALARRQARAERLPDRISARLGYERDGVYFRRAGSPLRSLGTIPHGTPAHRKSGYKIFPGGQAALDQRLKWRIRATVMAVFRSNYRYPGRDHGEETCTVTNIPSEVGCVQSQSKDWNLYSKSTKYPATVTDTYLTVPRNWISRVQSRGLAVVDGMMTLDAQALESHQAGVDLFGAVWLEQGRGYALHCRRGVIARSGALSAHGKDAAQAIRSLKAKALHSECDSSEITLRQIQSFVTRMRKHPNVLICVEDARATGSCEYGIRSWCHATGLDYEKGCETMDRVLDGYLMRPMPEVRRAILHALQARRQAA